MIALNQLLFDVRSPSYESNSVLSAWKQHGVIVLRHIFPEDALNDFIDNTERLLKYPAVAGTFGYYKKDFQKSFIDPFCIRHSSVDICLNKMVIQLIEAYMDSQCVLSEGFIKLDRPTPYVYFPLHSDYAPGHQRSPTSEIRVSIDDMKAPLAVGGAVYLRDSKEGAFCFCIGSHKLMAPKGPKISDYSAEEQQKIIATKLRIEGKRGDLVLFDDRGFHGPDHPSSKHRLVLLLDWLRVQSWNGPKQITSFRVFTSDLARLDDTQLRVLGVGAEPLTPREDYHLHSFQKKHQKLHRLTAAMINTTGRLNHWKRIMRSKCNKLRFW